MSYSMITTPSNSFGRLPKDGRLGENNNNPFMIDGNKKILEIWNKDSFKTENFGVNMREMKVNGWIHEKVTKVVENEIVEKMDEEHEEESIIESPKEEPQSPSHHARRPMNAFLIFCKKHRPIVRDRFPNLENRGVTKILGEWWSLLEEQDKTPFTNLANEYKDAFLTANPNFKWYKLPAPPLRTLMVRPSNSTTKLPSPQSSPSHTSPTPQIFKEFTPGKLADESQLGSLTSLLNNNFGNSEHFERKKSSVEINVNNNEVECEPVESPVNLTKSPELPPVPIKKRIFSSFPCDDTKEISSDILNEDGNETNCYYIKTEHQRKTEDSVTNQDLVDKIVDNLFFDKDDKTRKSGRQCKGKRYEKFMMEGKLLGNKRDATLTQNKPETVPEKKSDMSTPNLENTIKRLAERTKLSHFHDEEKEGFSSQIVKEHNNETSDEASLNTSFNLDEKINDLPSLSYDTFLLKKRESKKRKLRKISCENSKDSKEKSMRKEELVGSKKRKNKHSITHLEKKEEKSDFNDLLGLATLAEVAANTQKINET